MWHGRRGIVWLEGCIVDGGGEIAESSNVYFDFIDNDVLGTCVSRKMKSKI